MDMYLQDHLTQWSSITVTYPNIWGAEKTTFVFPISRNSDLSTLGWGLGRGIETEMPQVILMSIPEHLWRHSTPLLSIWANWSPLQLSLWVHRPDIPVNGEMFLKGLSVNVTSPSLFRTDHNFYGSQQMSWFLELSFRVTGLLRHLLPKEPEGMLLF